MDFFKQINTIQANVLNSEEINLLATICRNFKKRRKKTHSREMLNELSKRDLPRPIQIVVTTLLQSASGVITATAAEREPIERIDTEKVPCTAWLDLGEAVELILRYDSVRKVQTCLAYTERGIRTKWQKPDNELQEEAGELTSKSDVSLARKGLALDWLASHKFRTPTEEQLEFIIDTHHSIRVTARAGSGKTETIVVKILFLLHFIFY